MMWKTKKYAQTSALPAIAAALALSSTPAWSQEVQPTAEPEPITIAPPAPVPESEPVTTETTTTTDTTSEPTAATEAAPVAAKPKPKPAKSRQTATATRAASAAPAPAAPTSVATAAPATPQPIVDARPPATGQAAIVPEAPKPALNVDEDMLILGGGALALLALGGGAVAFARRRRHEEEELVEETAMDQPMTIEPEPMPRHEVIPDEQPAIVAPSAFAWGNPQPAETRVERREGESVEDETWVERAYRGPTPENPSLSLRKRLKRANFFDARERRVAAGKAAPIPMDAGLPEHETNDSRERELELA